MSDMRPELSKRNPYWIPTNRQYELKYFCRQYPFWKRRYAEIQESLISRSYYDMPPNDNVSDATSEKAIASMFYAERIRLIESSVMEADEYLYEYLLKGVTEGYSYNYLQTVFGIPCGKDMYYDRYRRFFWILDKKRD